MGLFDKLIGKAKPTPVSIMAQATPLTVCAPFCGAAIKLEEIPDPVFSQGILGLGCGIDPTEETVYAPFDGTITQLTDTKHAIGITSSDGIELLIHVGIDTVDMGGKGFNYYVEDGQQVKAGQPLMAFTLADIKAADHSPVTAVLITNPDDFTGVELLCEGQVEHGVPLLKLSK